MRARGRLRARCLEAALRTTSRLALALALASSAACAAAPVTRGGPAGKGDARAFDSVKGPDSHGDSWGESNAARASAGGYSDGDGSGAPASRASVDAGEGDAGAAKLRGALGRTARMAPDAGSDRVPLGFESAPAAAGSGAAAPRSLLVAIDPGHGGEKRGAIGPNRLEEKDAALAISLALRDQLEANGHRVILTRDTDRHVALRPRIRLANDAGADLFVSVHLNAVPASAPPGRALGVETYFLSADATDAGAAALALAENEDDDEPEAAAGEALGAILADLARSEAHVHSSRLAHSIHAALVRGTGARDRGLRQAPFVVLQGAAMPAVLVEVGYISHPVESRRLADPDGQRAIAASIAAGIDAFALDVIEREGIAAGSSSSQ